MRLGQSGLAENRRFLLANPAYHPTRCYRKRRAMVELVQASDGVGRNDLCGSGPQQTGLCRGNGATFHDYRI
jgi:hypothetical protein